MIVALVLEYVKPGGRKDNQQKHTGSLLHNWPVEMQPPLVAATAFVPASLTEIKACVKSLQYKSPPLHHKPGIWIHPRKYKNIRMIMAITIRKPTLNKQPISALLHLYL
jgi:hypothetical protein